MKSILAFQVQAFKNNFHFAKIKIISWLMPGKKQNARREHEAGLAAAMRTNKFFFTGLFVMAVLVIADSHGYNEKKLLVVESDKLIVTHFHDWSDANREQRRRVLGSLGSYGLKDPFSSVNDYAYIECRDKKSGHIRFKIPSIALTHIRISPDSRTIVGLSNIKFDNPLQMIVINDLGEVFFRMHISPKEAFLTHDDFARFKATYTGAYQILEGMDSFTPEGDGVYIDYSRMNMPGLLGAAWHYLFSKETSHHLLGDFGESVTNYIDWYKEPDPKIQFDYEGKELRSISLMDRSGKIRMEIPVEKRNWDYAGLNSQVAENSRTADAFIKKELSIKSDWLHEKPFFRRTKASFFETINSRQVVVAPISFAPKFGLFIKDCENRILAEAYSAGKNSFWLLNEPETGNGNGYTSLCPFFSTDMTIVTAGTASYGWLSEWRKGKEKETECPGNRTFPTWRIRSWDFEEAATKEALRTLHDHHGTMLGIISFNKNFKEEAIKTPLATPLKLETLEGMQIQGTGVDLDQDKLPDLFWFIQGLPGTTEKYFWLYMNVSGEWQCTWVDLIQECE